MSKADELREKAAQIRREIAGLEGKSVQEVEQEAREKKEQADEYTNSQQNKEDSDKSSLRNNNMRVPLPESPAEMILQARDAVERADDDGIKRQTVLFALVKDDETDMANVEAWPGGAQQMYRESAKPLTLEMMKQLYADPYAKSNVTAQDIWDFDGSAIMTTTQSNHTALIFANTDIKYTRDIQKLDEELADDSLLLLINPFWRNLESWGINILSPGAKKLAKKVIFDNDNYPMTYSFLRYDVRGRTCAALKAYPYDWQIYAYLPDEYLGYERPIWLGSSEYEPNGTMVTDLLVERPEYIQSWKKRFM
eukprot:CAMPEP_0194154106 /NCGR_PEP_ID=MMETSP0152-20130528/59216_1 /TAXON_ID=1049557 /ORGANISM="Thalassiothrix antarctica, Strain L6-D1" /LENGTH=308 /DNA_ID=CAMNT_0038859915 /DNA_START=185 /DNA_END=1111 /DNA_ORIENTATION=-